MKAGIWRLSAAAAAVVVMVSINSRFWKRNVNVKRKGSAGLHEDVEWKKPVKVIMTFIKMETAKLKAQVPDKGVQSTWENKIDPLQIFEQIVFEFIFGNQSFHQLDPLGSYGAYYQYPTADGMRSELFREKKAAYVPFPDLMLPDHCVLNTEGQDLIQTALDAFAIIMHGSQRDIRRIPRSFLLLSARALSMMKIEREKITATWSVIIGTGDPRSLPYHVLELYRPLFKYLSGNDIAKLNLSDERVLSYIGSYENLNRHQVGVVASTYIKLNPNWNQPKYLNIMNNLICGIPVTYLRRIPLDSFLQLSHQVFYHIRACDKIQRRFILSLLSKTQALGKSFSWTAQDVSHLGLLLAEVDGDKLKNINPEAMAGLTAHVIEEMHPTNLAYFTTVQIKYLNPKAYNVYSRKMKLHIGKLQNLVNSGSSDVARFGFVIIAIIINNLWK